MKQIPLAAALAAASICNFANAQSNVQLYGKLYPYIEQESGSGQSRAGTVTSSIAPATVTGLRGVQKVKGMSAGNSNIGFRGKEDLGGGLRAEFQLEGTVAVDSGAPGFSFNRNTFVGLEGGFGEVRLGFMDTVFKEYGDTLGILGISSGTPVSSSNILRKAPFGTNNTSRFHERRANSIRYDSPKVGNFEIGLQVATQEAPITVGALTGATGSAKTYSVGLKYETGPIYASLAYELHDNWYGGSSNARTSQSNIGSGIKSKDSAIQAAVEWRITKDQKVEFDVIRKNYDEKAVVANKFRNYKNMAYLVGYDGRFAGGWRVMAHYVRSQAGSCTLVNATCSTSGLEGSQVTAGVSYSLSRRTYVFAAYSQITNGASARFAALDLGGPVVPGEDTRHMLAGVAHSF